MKQGDDDTEREHLPTPRKLEQAREKGDIPRSQDLLSAAASAGFVLVALGFGAAAIAGAGGIASAYLSRLGSQSRAVEVIAMLGPLWPFFAAPAVLVLAVLLADRAFAPSAEKLMPKLSRINPVTNAGQRFGAEGLADFAKALAKVVMVGLMMVFYAQSQGDAMIAAAALEPRLAVAAMGRMAVDFLLLMLVLSVILGLADRLWQQHRWIMRNRMSRQEIIEESKDSEGDPHVKGERRRKGQEIAMNQMLADVPKADVVIVNPTHFAVALKWDRRAGIPPVCVAKGTDDVALRIRASAAEAGVPIHRDPPTARALHAAVKIGEPIRPEHYRAVAAAIRFAEAMRRRAKGIAT